MCGHCASCGCALLFVASLTWRCRALRCSTTLGGRLGYRRKVRTCSCFECCGLVARFLASLPHPRCIVAHRCAGCFAVLARQLVALGRKCNDARVAPSTGDDDDDELRSTFSQAVSTAVPHMYEQLSRDVARWRSAPHSRAVEVAPQKPGHMGSPDDGACVCTCVCRVVGVMRCGVL
jgi:hypothetical protein